MLTYPEEARKAEDLLKAGIASESNDERKKRLERCLDRILTCKEFITLKNSYRHLEHLLPRCLKEVEKELNVRLK